MRFSLACAFALSVTASTVLAQIPYSWSYNRLIAPSPLETVIALSFGVPETDQQQASIQCSIGHDPHESNVAPSIDELHSSLCQPVSQFAGRLREFGMPSRFRSAEYADGKTRRL